MDRQKSIIITYGRMNPPHKGHEMLIKKMLNGAALYKMMVASENENVKFDNPDAREITKQDLETADVCIYLTETKGNKNNPLQPGLKKELVGRMIAALPINSRRKVTVETIPNIYKSSVITELKNKYKYVIAVLGDDRINPKMPIKPTSKIPKALLENYVNIRVSSGKRKNVNANQVFNANNISLISSKVVRGRIREGKPFKKLLSNALRDKNIENIISQVIKWNMNDRGKKSLKRKTVAK